MTSINSGKTLKYLKIQDTNGPKISESIIYVKEYFYIFLFSEIHTSTK